MGEVQMHTYPGEGTDEDPDQWFRRKYLCDDGTLVDLCHHKHVREEDADSCEVAKERLDNLRAAEEKSKSPDALTDAEHRVIELLGQAAEIYCGEVLQRGPTMETDQYEFIAHIHDLQFRVMGQAAARAYPGKYRLQGGVV